MASEQWHTATVRIPFRTAAHAVAAKRALEVDHEPNAGLVERAIEAEADELVVTYRTATVRLLRLCTNSLLSSADLVVRTMADFAPDSADPVRSPEQLEAEAAAVRGAGPVRGIELREGKGAGGGDEVGA
ncbi:hypothetical protein Q5752_005006 [Cryptotrichosporon argae]